MVWFSNQSGLCFWLFQGDVQVFPATTGEAAFFFASQIIHGKGKTMYSLMKRLLLISLLIMPGLFAGAQTAESVGKPADSASGNATKQEVEQLRQEVLEQRQTIEQLKAMVQQLVDAKSQQSAPASAEGDRTVAAPAGAEPQVVNTTLVQGGAQATQKPADKKESGPPITAGWTGEHFFIRSADGKFQLQPYGYLQTDYRAYNGDGAPANTFVIRRARFGFQGNYGKYYDFALLADVASTTVTLRDAYLNVKPVPEVQVQAGQFKVPWAQEQMAAATNLDFIERSLASLLYPSAASAFRSPGADVHGDIKGGVVQYWTGVFNERGFVANNTQNWPDIIGRLRLNLWKNKKDSLFQGLAFGGSIGYGKTRGLSNEVSFTAVTPDAAFTFFPSFRVNGPVERYEGEFYWSHKSWSLAGEYNQLLQERQGIGSATPGGLGFLDLPGVRAKAGYIQGTYLITGESKAWNTAPKVKNALLGPEAAPSGGLGLGAWEVAFRYDKIRTKAPGADLFSIDPITPGFVTTFNNSTDAFTVGVNWYWNYWIKYQANFSVDRLQQVSINSGVLPQNFYVVLQRLQFRF
ncbi:MAG TPA: porin [Candidatus Angelobacter sp.]|nr:porin [Candidatus Angelobacter sp.]